MHLKKVGTKIAMFDQGCIVCREVQLKNQQSYVIYIFVKENNHDEISLFLTDCETVLLGDIKAKEIANLASELAIGQDLSAYISNLFRTSVKQNTFEYSEDESKLTFTLSRGHKLSVDLKKAPSEDNAMHLKFLLFQLAKQISSQEELLHPLQSARSVPPVGGGLVALHQFRAGKAISHKRRAAGMSIVNPSSKRIYTTPGVQFDEG